MGSRFVQLKNSCHYHLTRLSFTIPCGNEQLIGLGFLPTLLARPGAGSRWSKVVKNALTQVVGEARRTPSLIELQIFVSDAIRIVNDRPLTTISSTPDDLPPLTLSCFLGQHLAPNTPVSAFHDRRDLRRDYEYCATLAQRFW